VQSGRKDQLKEHGHQLFWSTVSQTGELKRREKSFLFWSHVAEKCAFCPQALSKEEES